MFAFRVDGEPWAIPHRSLAGGRLVDLPGGRGRLLAFRPPGAAVQASTEAWRVGPQAAPGGAPLEELLAAARTGQPGFTPLEGFDTFWYTWVGVNRDTGLLRP